jgi:GH24 family phage-related lysozyme (muramidase)
MLHPKLTKAGVELVKSFEGLRRKAARLDGGRWTLRYRHTSSSRVGANVTAV